MHTSDRFHGNLVPHSRNSSVKYMLTFEVSHQEGFPSVGRMVIPGSGCGFATGLGSGSGTGGAFGS